MLQISSEDPTINAYNIECKPLRPCALVSAKEPPQQHGCIQGESQDMRVGWVEPTSTDAHPVKKCQAKFR